MKYDNATLKGRWKLWIIGLLEKTKNKNRLTDIIHDQNYKKNFKKKYNIQIYNKKHNQIKVPSDKNQINLNSASLEKIWDLFPMRLLNRSTKKSK